MNTLLARITIFVNDINEQIISNNNITFTVENEEYKKNIESYLNSQEPVKEPVKEVVKEPVKEVVKEPVKDVVEEPVKDVVKEVVEKVIKEK